MYLPAQTIADALERPLDQAVYMLGSTTVLLVCLILYRIQGEKKKKTWSLITGILIHFYVFGVSSFASLAQNLLSYLILVVFPADYQHIAIFVASGASLAAAQLHK